MPKEVIKYSNEYVIRDGRVVYNPDVVGDRPAEEGEEVRRTEEYALHWSKGSSGVVQLSVQVSVDQLRSLLAMYEKNDWMGEEVKPGMVMFYSEGFRRHELQQLVRAGRRARNDVFGADE